MEFEWSESKRIAVLDARQERFKAIGRTGDGRGVLIVFTLRVRDGETLIRPMSARYMRQKESEYCEEEAAKIAQ
jgi:uncharacterized protein